LHEYSVFAYYYYDKTKLTSRFARSHSERHFHISLNVVCAVFGESKTGNE